MNDHRTASASAAATSHHAKRRRRHAEALPQILAMLRDAGWLAMERYTPRGVEVLAMRQRGGTRRPNDGCLLTVTSARVTLDMSDDQCPVTRTTCMRWKGADPVAAVRDFIADVAEAASNSPAIPVEESFRW